MRIVITRREAPPRWFEISIRFVSILIALLVMAVAFWAYGVNPLVAYKKLLWDSFTTKHGFSETVVTMIPLLLSGIGLSIAFKAQFWNIGAEGQLLLGAIAATGVALRFPDTPAYLMIPLMFFVGFLAGAAWGLIPAFLRARLQVNEVISTLMMNYIADRLLLYLVSGPWSVAEVIGQVAYAGFYQTNLLPEHLWLPVLGGTRIHWPTLLIAFVSLIGAYLIMTKTPLGYEIVVVGENPEAAKFAGIKYLKVALLTMVISGGLAGIAGVGEVAGIHHRLRSGFSAGYGYTAIIVAWLGGLNPVLILISSLLFGGLLRGGYLLRTMGIRIGIVNMFNGIILFFILISEFFVRYRIRIRR